MTDLLHPPLASVFQRPATSDQASARIALAPQFLGQITGGLARTPASWQPLVAFDDDALTTALLLPGTNYGVWVASWNPEQELPLGPTSGHQAITVVEGTLTWTEFGERERSARLLPTGETLEVPAGSAAVLTNIGPARAVSLHAVAERGEVAGR